MLPDLMHVAQRTLCSVGEIRDRGLRVPRCLPANSSLDVLMLGTAFSVFPGQGL